MDKSRFATRFCILLLMGCGVDENRNNPLLKPSEAPSAPSNDIGTMGIDGKNARVAGDSGAENGLSSPSKHFESYVRFKQPNGVECSGVLAYEPRVDSAEMVDVYLYSALHCLKETNPLGYLKNSSPKIAQAYAYRIGGPLTTPVSTTLITDSKAIHVMRNGLEPADIVRIWQFRAPLRDVSQRAFPVCTSRLSDSVPEDVAAVGFYIEKGNPFELVPAPMSWHRVSGEFQHKLISTSLSRVDARTERLKTRLQQFFGATTTVSPFLLKLGETSSQPGESGSPVYSVTTKILKSASTAAKSTTEISGYKCLAGVLAREVAQRAATSSRANPQIAYDTYFSPFRDAADRAWFTFDGTQDVTRSFAPSASLLAERTFNSLDSVDISKNPLGFWRDAELFSDLKLDTLFGIFQIEPGVQQPVHIKIEGHENNINVENLFGSAVFKSNVRKVLQIEPSATVSSTSTRIPAVFVPAGSGGVIVIRNFGRILGKGGSAGQDGGDALHVRSPTRVLNHGLIAGGGGGGGNGGNGGRGGDSGHNGKASQIGRGAEGGEGGTGGTGQDLAPAQQGKMGKNGAVGFQVTAGLRGGTGGGGGQGGSGGGHGKDGVAGQAGGSGGNGANGVKTRGGSGAMGTAGGPAGKAGFAIQGTKLINGKMTVRTRCLNLESKTGEILGRQRDAVSEEDLGLLGCPWVQQQP